MSKYAILKLGDLKWRQTFRFKGQYYSYLYNGLVALEEESKQYDDFELGRYTLRSEISLPLNTFVGVKKS